MLLALTTSYGCVCFQREDETGIFSSMFLKFFLVFVLLLRCLLSRILFFGVHIYPVHLHL